MSNVLHSKIGAKLMAETDEFRNTCIKVLEDALEYVRTGAVIGVVAAVIKEDQTLGYGLNIDLSKADDLMMLLLKIYHDLERKRSESHGRNN